MLLPLYYKYERGFIEKPLLYYLIRDSSISHCIKSKEDILNSYLSYNEILNKVIDEIKMPYIENNNYKKMIFIRYTRERLNLAFLYKDKELLKSQYNILFENKCLLIDDILKYYSSNNYIFIVLYKIINKCIGRIKKWNRFAKNKIRISAFG